ncbi:MAG: transglutaminase-like domain-containing protein [Candidatus Binatia bacterium]
MKHLLTVLAVVVWVGMVAALVHKQAPQQTTPIAALAELPAGAKPEQDEWFGVFQSDRKIGYAHRVVARTKSGWAFQEDSAFTLAMLGTVQNLQTTMSAETDESYGLDSFRFGLISPAASFSASGRNERDKLVVQYGASGQQNRLEIPLREPINLPSTLRPRLVRAEAPPGTQYTASVFSPLSMKNEPITLVLEGRETIDGPDGKVETVRISEKHQGIENSAWLAMDGTVIREQGTLGFVLQRAKSRDDALAGISSAAPIDLVMKTRIPVDHPIADARELSSLTLRMKGGASTRVPDDPPRQRVESGLLHIVREPAPHAIATGMPPRGSDAPAIAAYTDPSPFVESDDPAIVSLARSIVGDEQDPVVAARKLVGWVNVNVAKEPALTVPSAREVAKSLRGDCNEHAVLLTALARAVGIPARVVAGTVYGDLGVPGDEGFYYHAWSELWLGSWVSADAVFGQMPADATHVKLLEGGPERHMALGEVIGQLEFEQTGGGSTVGRQRTGGGS